MVGADTRARGGCMNTVEILPLPIVGSNTNLLRLWTYVGVLEQPKHRYIVSTSGAWILDGRITEIGCNRFYETMVFKAVRKRMPQGFDAWVIDDWCNVSFDFLEGFCFCIEWEDGFLDACRMHQNNVEVIVNYLRGLNEEDKKENPNN